MMKEIKLRYFRAIPVLLIIIISLGCAPTRQEPVVFKYDRATFSAAKPWTSENFKNNPDNFQFVIIGDRSGGANVLEKVERSKHFTLLDLAAVVFAGPVGLVVTKGLDLVVLVASDYGGVTQIQIMVSNWIIKNGILEIDDVAFATKKNRIAAKGHINLIDKTVNITFAVLNKDGSCRSMQNIKGNLDDPEFGEIKIIEAILSPLTNLFKSVFPIESDVFYAGSVQHPE